MNTATKVLFSISESISVIWTNAYTNIVHPDWWIFTKFPEDNGIYVWEEGQGVRKPTNQEWWKMINGENPVEEDLSEAVLGEWLAPKEAAQ